jgi:hypothetical protein
MFDALNEPYLRQQADAEPLVSNEQVRILESRTIWWGLACCLAFNSLSIAS